MIIIKLSEQAIQYMPGKVILKQLMGKFASSVDFLYPDVKM